MNGLDYTVAVIVLLSLSLGLWRGLIHEILALLGWPLAFLLSQMFSADVARWMPLKQETVRVILSYALVFVAALILWSVAASLIARLMKAVGAGWTDRMLGGLFGIMRGALVLLVLAWMIGLTNYFERPFWRDAASHKALEDAALMTKGWLPDDIAQRIHYGIHS